MRRRAANDGAHRDNGVIPTAHCQPLRHHGHLPGAGHIDSLNVLLGNPMTPQGIHGAGGERFDHKGIKTRRQNREPGGARGKITFNHRHGITSA